MKEGGGIASRAFVVVVSAAASSILGFSVVSAIGYPPHIGALYSLGYFAAMLLFFDAFGYSLFRRKG